MSPCRSEPCWRCYNALLGASRKGAGTQKGQALVPAVFKSINAWPFNKSWEIEQTFGDFARLKLPFHRTFRCDEARLERSEFMRNLREESAAIPWTSIIFFLFCCL